LSSLTVGLRYSQSRLCSIDNRLVDELLSLLEFVGFLELVNPFEQEKYFFIYIVNHGSKQIERFQFVN
jgi:hypothetical protein